jgi:transcriptional regulator with XRE-family HTH domain
MTGENSPRQRFDELDNRRESLGLSVARLCRRADISTSAYQRLAKDKNRKPNYRTIRRLEQALQNLEGATA